MENYGCSAMRSKFNKTFEYESQYSSLVERILDYSPEELNERTGLKTRRVANSVMTVSRSPVMLGKKLYWQSAIEEILWIMQKGSNNIHDLRPHIWDEWADQDGSIKKAYGYQISKFDQVRKLLKDLSENPSSRRGVIDIWNVADLGEMNLVPCCYSSVWNISNGELNCMLVQRSGDIGLGVPFNTTQYWALLLMFAKHLKVKPGTLMHCIADAHIYENHYDGLREYLNRTSCLNFASMYNYAWSDNVVDNMKIAVKICDEIRNGEVPELILDTDKTNFYDFTVDDFKFINYHPFPAIKLDVAV